MEILYLKAYGSGYRGCAIQPDRYLFFQYSRKKGLKQLKSYPKTEFPNLDHFMAMMQKFITPPTFLKPPPAIAELTLEELDRVHAQITGKRKQADIRHHR